MSDNLVFATITKSFNKKTLEKMKTVNEMKNYLNTYFYRITIPSVHTILYDANKQQTIVFSDLNIKAILPKNKKIVPPKAEIKTDEESDEEPNHMLLFKIHSMQQNMY